MVAPENADLPFVASVLHPTDFSEASERAFAHALAIALVRRTRFALLHVAAGSLEDAWTEFPPVRRTLERWGLLEPGSARKAVFEQLGMRVEKVAARGRDPVRSIVDHLERDPVELIVLATEGRNGMPRWLRASVAEDVAARTRALTLFVPSSARGFVDLDDGHLSLRRIVVPVVETPSAAVAVELAARVSRAVGEGAVEVTLLHVGEYMPPSSCPMSRPAGSFWRRGAVRSSTRSSTSWLP